MRISKSLIILSMLFSFSALAKVKITGIDYSKKGANEALVTVKMQGNIKGTPELSIKDNIVQVVVPDSFVWPKIEKKVGVNQNFDTTLMAYQFDKEVVRVRTILPYSLKGKESLVSLTLNDGEISLSIPKAASTKAVTRQAPRRVKKVAKAKKAVAKNNGAEKFDESYLEQLIHDKSEAPKKKAVAKNDMKKDTVSSKMSATSSPLKEADNSFSLTSYVSKIVAFLALMILGFYIVMNLMRKGVLKKSKLNLFNDTKSVEVLSTTYIAPKKSVVMLRAHNQVFLVGSSESGLQLISEVNDVPGLVKTAERSISGENFDTNLETASQTDREFKLKEEVAKNNQEASETDLAGFLQNNPVADKVKLSDQIKSKVKNLKSLQ